MKDKTHIEKLRDHERKSTRALIIILILAALAFCAGMGYAVVLAG